MKRQVLDALPCGVFEFGPDGRVRAANPEALRLFGLSPDEALELTSARIAEIATREDGSPCALEDCLVEKSLSSGEQQGATTLRVPRPDGSIAWCIFRASPIREPVSRRVTGALLAFVDISERKAAEAELRLAENTLRSVLTDLPSIVVSADPEGRIEYANRTPAGMSMADLLGTSIYDRVEPKDVPTVKAVVQGVLATGKPDAYEMRVERDGVSRAWSVKVGPVFRSGRTAGITMIATDVTQLKDLQSRLIIADRLASIGTLAAGVAHEINNPLTYVLIKLRTVARELAAGNRPVAALVPEIEACVTGAERMSRIVRDLGLFARSPADSVEAIDVAAVVDLAIQMAANEIRFRARLVRDIDELPPVLGDASRLGQVFLNLLINAAHAIEEGNVEGNQIRVSARQQADGWVSVEVADTGRGIEPDLLPRVFDPFVTTKDVGQGTGLGLHICNRIVGAMGGELTVTSQVGRGATFTVRLPVSDGLPAVEPGAAAPAVVAAPAGGLDVMVIDDEPTIRQIVALELSEHRVARPASGREALALFAERRFDIVFCDLNMPDLTGIDIYEQVARERPEQAKVFVFMTGGVFTPRARRFMAAQPRPFIEKPFAAEELHRCIARHARRS